MDCSLAGTTSAVCAESFGGTEANFPGTSMETFTGTDYTFMPVTITGAAAAVTSSSSSVVKGGPSPTTKMSGGGATIASKSGTGTTASSPKATGSGTAASLSSSAGTSTSTAGVPAITGNARWVAGGAAMAMAMAVLA